MFFHDSINHDASSLIFLRPKSHGMEALCRFLANRATGAQPDASAVAAGGGGNPKVPWLDKPKRLQRVVGRKGASETRLKAKMGTRARAHDVYKPVGADACIHDAAFSPRTLATRKSMMKQVGKLWRKAASR